MSKNFEGAIQLLRIKVATESAETTARFKRMETDLNTRMDNVEQALEQAVQAILASLNEMKDGNKTSFQQLGELIETQARQHQENMDTLLKIVLEHINTDPAA